MPKLDEAQAATVESARTRAKAATAKRLALADPIPTMPARPDGKIVVSYSELDTFRQCPLKHRWSYIERWSKPQEEGSALSRGTLWHTVLEAHYNAIKQWQSLYDNGRFPVALTADRRNEILGSCLDAVMPLLHAQGAQTAQQELVEWMYRGYVEHHGLDSAWSILSVENRDLVPLLNAAGRPSRYWIKVKIDLIVRDWEVGGLWVVDHKSAKDLDRPKDIDLDDQFGLYTAGVRWRLARDKIGNPNDLVGSVYSGARTQRNKGPMVLESRFARTRMFRSQPELDAIMRDAYTAARAAYSKQNRDNPYSSPNPNQCGWKCDFLDVHLAVRKGIDPRHALPDFGFEQNFERH